MKERYQKAERLLGWNIPDNQLHIDISPEWLEGKKLSFSNYWGEDKQQMIVDYSDTAAIKKSSLPIQPKNPEPSPLVSPCKRWEIQLEDNNLYSVSRINKGVKKALTTNGSDQLHYFLNSFEPIMGGENSLTPAALWSPSSNFVVVQQVDQHGVEPMVMVQYVHDEPTVRPRLYSYPMGLPGDRNLPQVRYVVVDRVSGENILIDRPSQPMPSVDPISNGFVWWGDDEQLYFIEMRRGQRSIALVRFNVRSKKTQLLLQQKDHTGVYATVFFHQCPPLVRLLPNIQRFIWFDYSSGWGHLYWHNLETGKRMMAITQGDYTVTSLHKVDLVNKVIFFEAVGKEAGRNPYYPHLYRVNFEGDDLRLLTPENSYHHIQSQHLHLYDDLMSGNKRTEGISPDFKVFIDTISRVDQVPECVLRSTEDGRILDTLAKVKKNELTDLTCAIPFQVKAADSKTDLWGALYRPSNFDASQIYPVILVLYGGPQISFSPKRYGQISSYMGGNNFALAELGFIVVSLDPRGTPLRSKAFQDVCHGHLYNGGGIDDQVWALKQLAEKYDWIDMSRVGIAGFSGGAFAATRAMFTHSDLFKVGVAAAGNHDARLFYAWWAETFHGMPDEEDFEFLSNDYHASKLNGKLLLVHGCVDRGVPVANTMRLINKLIESNRDFDLLILPKEGHLFCDDKYFIRKTWDYFVEHLAGGIKPQQYFIK